jgi:hypothetical protein
MLKAHVAKINDENAELRITTKKYTALFDV